MAKDLEEKKKKVAEKMKGERCEKCGKAHKTKDHGKKPAREEFKPEDDFDEEDEHKEKKAHKEDNGKMPKASWLVE